MNEMLYEIKRQNSQYSRYIRWYLNVYLLDMRISSSIGYKTRVEAEYAVERMIRQGKEGFPIGNHISYTNYKCIGA